MIQSGYAELGIQLFKSDIKPLIEENQKLRNEGKYFSPDLSGQIVLPRYYASNQLAKFANKVTEYVSGETASELVQDLCPESIPVEVNYELISACLKSGDRAVAHRHIKDVVRQLGSETSEIGYTHKQILDVLVEHQQVSWANQLASALIMRAEQIDANDKLEKEFHLVLLAISLIMWMLIHGKNCSGF